MSSLLPSNRNRSLLVHSLVKAFKLLTTGHAYTSSSLKIINPKPAEYKDLAAFHTRDYLDFVLDPNSLSDDGQRSEFGLEEVSSR